MVQQETETLIFHSSSHLKSRLLMLTRIALWAVTLCHFIEIPLYSQASRQRGSQTSVDEINCLTSAKSADHIHHVHTTRGWCVTLKQRVQWYAQVCGKKIQCRCNQMQQGYITQLCVRVRYTTAVALILVPAVEISIHWLSDKRHDEITYQV